MDCGLKKQGQNADKKTYQLWFYTFWTTLRILMNVGAGDGGGGEVQRKPKTITIVPGRGVGWYIFFKQLIFLNNWWYLLEKCSYTIFP